MGRIKRPVWCDEGKKSETWRGRWKTLVWISGKGPANEEVVKIKNIYVVRSEWHVGNVRILIITMRSAETVRDEIPGPFTTNENNGNNNDGYRCVYLRLSARQRLFETNLPRSMTMTSTETTGPTSLVVAHNPAVAARRCPSSTVIVVGPYVTRALYRPISCTNRRSCVSHTRTQYKDIIVVAWLGRTTQNECLRRVTGWRTATFIDSHS